ncbi:MAG: polyketide synthase dehydratase domain-containing protein, partial [Methylococcales bacterium]
TGMVTPEVAEQFKSRGVPLIEPSAGRFAAWRQFQKTAGPTRVLLGDGSWVQSARSVGSVAIPAKNSRARKNNIIGISENTAPLSLLNGKPLSRSVNGSSEMLFVLDAKNNLLRDHQIKGRPVLAMTVALELMAQVAGTMESDRTVTAVRDLRVLSGISLDSGNRDIIVRCERNSEDTSAASHFKVSIVNPVRGNRALYQAVVTLSQKPVAPPRSPEFVALDGSFPLDTRDAYDRWLFHGPTFQVLQGFNGLSEIGLDARVHYHSPGKVQPSNEHRGWVINPIVLDAASQLGVLWSRAMHGRNALPNYVRAVHRYGPIDGEMPLDLKFRISGPNDGDSYQADAWFIRDGNVIALLEGLEGTGYAELNRMVEGQ